VEGASARRDAIDERLQAVADNWELHRMAAVDRSLLRLASYELLHCADTPVGVIIDEAIEIAKSFSGEEAGSFINGILDKIKDSRK
ncbi:MAG: transcription antitermination factor NusB, partial [Elusimicrobiota bacterium]